MVTRPLRVISVQVGGQPAKALNQNEGRLRLLTWVIDRVGQQGWGLADALMLPAGFVHAEAPLGPLDFEGRIRRFGSDPLAFALQRASERLAEVNGAALVVGVDTRPYLAGFRGDQLLLALQGATVVGLARKVFASPIDTASAPSRSYLAFAHDVGAQGRVILLPRGDRAVLCPCYDAFAFGRIGRAVDSHRQYLAAVGGAPKLVSAVERAEIHHRLRADLLSLRPTVALIGIHGFDQPGRDTRWQRHGVACASAALKGGLAVAAAHFRYWLPDAADGGHSSLASVGVGRRHLGLGLHRCARRLASAAAISVRVPGSSTLVATVRLFEF